MATLKMPTEVLESDDPEFVALCYAARARFEIEAALNSFFAWHQVQLPASGLSMAARWTLAEALLGAIETAEVERTELRRVEMAWNLLADQCHLNDRVDVARLGDLQAVFAECNLGIFDNREQSPSQRSTSGE